MADNIIEVSGLKKEFRVPQKEKEGLIASIKSLFRRKYKDVQAVKGIDFHVRRGEIRGLIGPNGAGKSTTIKVLSGILHPTEGYVNVMGHTPWLERETYVRKIGALFGQKSQLWWDIPAFDTFALHKVMYKIDDAVYRKTIDEFVELLGLEDIINRPVRQLSLGERMKCELVCAMLHGPDLIFLDEPTIGLDVMAKEAIRNFIKRINKERGTTFILTTHDMSDIEDLCERVTVINHGTIVFDADMDQMKRYFSERKLIDIRFSEPVEEQSLAPYQLQSFNGLTATLELNLATRDLQSQIAEIFQKYPINDINVNNIPIEQVIKDIYSRQAE